MAAKRRKMLKGDDGKVQSILLKGEDAK